MHLGMRAIALAAVLLLVNAPAWPQATLKQLGPVVPQHLSMYAGNGQVMDAGGITAPGGPPANSNSPGTRPTGLGIVNPGLGYAQFTGYANASHAELLWGFTESGDGLIKLDRVGDDTPLTLYCEINHVRQPCGTLSNISIRPGTGLMSDPDPLTTTGEIWLADTAVATGTYTYATVTVDQQGRITSISSGDTPPTPVAPGDPDGSLQYNCAGAFCGATIAPGLDMSAGILSLTQVLNDRSGGDYTILTEDGATTILVGAHTYTLPQAGTVGFENKWGACLLNIGAGDATLGTTTSLFEGAGGGTSLTLRPGDWACPSSDGTNYPTLAGFNYLGLSAGLPVIGGGAGAPLSQGTRSGTGTLYVTTTGAQTSGRCVEIDASGNHIPAATSCGGGSGSVTQVNTGTGLTGGPITTTGTVALADTAVTPSSYTYATLTVDQQGRLTAASSGAAPASAANPTGTAGPVAVNGSASTFMRSDGAPAVQKASAAQFGIVEVDGTTITASSGVISSVGASGANPTGTIGTSAVNGSSAAFMRSDGAPAAAAATTSVVGIAKLYENPLAIGWPATVDPNKNVIATINQASTVTAIVGRVDTAVGSAATVSVYKAPSGTACASGTVLHSGSFDANGTAVTNQTLTVTTSSLSAGDSLCLVTTGGSNWTGGVGIGGITVFVKAS